MYEVQVKRIKRSNQANAYYWAIVDIIAKELGYTKEEMHESFKGHFLGFDAVTDAFGNEYKRPRSSAILNKKEFAEYINKVQAFAHMQELILPTPDYYGHKL